MKILITGGAGFIGTNLCKKLVKDNIVYSIDDYSIGSKLNHIEGVKYIEGDVNTIKSKIDNDFDICFHLAGLSRIFPSFKNPRQTFNSNTKGVISVLDWCKTNNTKMIYAGSSSRHYDHYQSPYATFKFLGEEICRMYRRVYKMNIEIARFYNVYGPREVMHEKFGNVIGIWKTKVKNGEPLPIVGDGNQRRDFTHVHDIVDGLIKIALSNHQHEDAWELGTGNNYSVNELFEMFNKKFNVSSINIPDQPGNYKKTLRKNDDLLNLLGWKPKDRLNNHIQNLEL